MQNKNKTNVSERCKRPVNTGFNTVQPAVKRGKQVDLHSRVVVKSKENCQLKVKLKVRVLTCLVIML